jgi:uncharacterized tellurite resistance protein B-like protein
MLQPCSSRAIPAGLANALKRIAASPLSSSVRAVRGEEIGHMLFATGRRSLAGLMATHPPVEQRIRALDPNWKPGEAPPPLPQPPTETAAERAARERREAPGGAGGPLPRIPGMPQLPGLEPVAAAALVGVVDLAMAERVLAAVPEPLRRAVLEPEGAAATCLALLLDSTRSLRASQLALLESRLGAPAADRIAAAAGHRRDLSPTLRLALLDLASPALHHLPAARREDLLHLAQRLIELDGVIQPGEAALAAALESRLSPEGSGKPDPEGALAMLALLARAGHEDDGEAQAAWQKGVTLLEKGRFPLPAPLPGFQAVATRAGADTAAHAAQLAHMQETLRRLLMAAMAEVAAHDGVIRPRELEILRAAAAALGCPMPPVGTQPNGSIR